MFFSGSGLAWAHVFSWFSPGLFHWRDYLGSYIFSLWVQFKGQGLDKAVSLLALDLSFKVKIGLGTLFFFLWFLFKKIRLLLLRGGPSHTYLLFWRGAVSSRSVISSGNISSCFGPKLFQGQDWSRHTHFLVLAWASSFEGLVQAPYFCFLF